MFASIFWSFFDFEFELPEIELIRPVVVLEKNNEGQANWEFGDPTAAAVAEATVPADRTEIPVIGELTIDDGRLTYRDPIKGIDITTTVTEALAEGGEGERRLTLKGEGRFAGKPFSLDVVAGALNRLRDEEEPYPIKLSAAIGETKVSADGTMTRPREAKEINMDLSISGADLADLFPIVGISLAPSPPYSLEGHLTRDDDVWDFTDVQGQIGESDLGGDVKVDMSEERPTFYANLTSRNLSFEDLGPFIGVEEENTSSEKAADKPSERVLPDAPIDLHRLRAMDARVVFAGKKVLAPNLPIDDLNFTAKLANGRLLLDPIEFGVADGEVGGTISLNGQEEVPRIKADIDIREVGLKPFFRQTDYFNVSEGLFGGHLELQGAGGSISDMLGASRGRLVVAMTGGTISGLALEAIGLDIAEALGIVISDEQAGVPIRCAVVDLPVTDGIGEVKTMVLDTRDSKIAGEGTISLAEESLELKILAHPKDPSLLSGRTPVLVEGTFADPSIGLDPSGLAARGVAAAALGVVLTPIAALIPFIDLGLGEDSNCDGLIREARKFAE